MCRLRSLLLCAVALTFTTVAPVGGTEPAKVHASKAGGAKGPSQNIECKIDGVDIVNAEFFPIVSSKSATAPDKAAAPPPKKRVLLQAVNMTAPAAAPKQAAPEKDDGKPDFMGFVVKCVDKTKVECLGLPQAKAGKVEPVPCATDANLKASIKKWGKKNSRRLMAASRSPIYAWPLGIVCYEFASDFKVEGKTPDQIIKTIKDGYKDTQIQFISASECRQLAARGDPQGYLAFTHTCEACSDVLSFENAAKGEGTHASDIGYASAESRELFVEIRTEADKAKFEPSILHEMAHILGLDHEHQRSDRDKYMGMNWKVYKDLLAEKGITYPKQVTLNNLARISTLKKLELKPSAQVEYQLGDYDLKSIVQYVYTGFCELKPEFKGKPHNFCDPELDEDDKKAIGGCEDFDAKKYCGPELEFPRKLSEEDEKAVDFMHRTMIQLRTNANEYKWTSGDEATFRSDHPFTGFANVNGIVAIPQAKINEGAAAARNAKTVKNFEVSAQFEARAASDSESSVSDSESSISDSDSDSDTKSSKSSSSTNSNQSSSSTNSNKSSSSTNSNKSNASK